MSDFTSMQVLPLGLKIDLVKEGVSKKLGKRLELKCNLIPVGAHKAADFSPLLGSFIDKCLD